MEQTDQTYLETIEQSAEQILAPVLVEFVEWILRSAGRHGIRRIYFLARDGYPMYRAAEILSAGMSPRIECRYLRCSRYSLRVPSFCLLGRAAVDQICLGGIDVTLRKVLKRGGLTEQEAEETARAMGREEELDRILSYRQVRSLRGMLARTELFWEYVSLHAKKAYDGTVGYLRSQGLFEDMDYAVADSGWTGSIQRTLSMLVSSAGYQGQITGYYFGLWHIPADAEKGEYHAYYFGPLGKIRRKASFSNSLFECICSEPAGMTTGYRRTAEGYVPEEEQGRIENQEALELIHQAVIRRAEQEVRRRPGEPALLREARGSRGKPAEDREKKGRQTRAQKRTWKKFRQLMGRPDRAQAEAFGRMKFTDDVLDAGHLLAPQLTEQEIRQNHFAAKIMAMTGVRKTTVRESAWMEGSIVRSGGAVRWHLLQNRIYKYLLYIKKDILERIK